MKFRSLTVSALGESVHVGEYILNLYLGVSYILLEKVHGVLGLERMKPIEASSLVLHASLELLQSIVGGLHLSVNFLGQSLQSFESVQRRKNSTVGKKSSPERIGLTDPAGVSYRFISSMIACSLSWCSITKRFQFFSITSMCNSGSMSTSPTASKYFCRSLNM